MRIAINGFGRIGRLYLRALFGLTKDLEIIAVNDLQTLDSAIHLLMYDSVHGRFNLPVKKVSETEFSVDGHHIKYFSKKCPEELPWQELDIDLVVECTGVFLTKELSSMHIAAGAKKVLVSCPSKDADRTIVFGVNNNSLTKDDVFVSNGSCTTNCLAPIIKILQENFGIEKGHFLTVHSYTGDQRIVDLPHKDFRRARAGATNIIPTSTGASRTIERIFPELKGKISGLAVRVPTPNVSMIDFSFSTKKKIDEEGLKLLIKKYAETELKGVLGYTEDALVSSDFNHSPLSSVVDLPLLQVIGDYSSHIVSWYDNEWGFANRMIDVSCLIGKV